MRISVERVRPEVLESAGEAGGPVTTRVRYNILLSDDPRSQWRACFMSPSSYSPDALPSLYTFGKMCVSYECPRRDGRRLFDQLRAYIRQANARSRELEDLSGEPPPRAGAGGPVSRKRHGHRGRADDVAARGSARDLAALGREIEAEVRNWPTGSDGER